MTTSTILACKGKSWPVLVLAPTRRILKETVANAAGDAVRIPGNSECPLIEPDLQKNPILRQLPLTLPDCEKCSEADWCDVLAILRAGNPSVMGLTYAKLEALMLSRGMIAKEILHKISRAEVVLLDECHELALPKEVSVKAFVSLNIPGKYTALDRIYQHYLTFCQNHIRTIKELMELSEHGHAGQHLSRSAENIQYVPWKELKKAWAQLRKLAVAHEVPDDAVLQLRDIITIMASSQANFSYISEDEGEGGSVHVTAGQARQFRAMNEFLVTVVDQARLLFVSGTAFEPQPQYFSALAGRQVKQAIFPDLRHATQKLTLIPDRWRLTSWNFSEKLPIILETIQAIAEREKQPIYLLAPNGRKARWLAQEIAKLGLRNIFVDYYRSDHSVGVKRSERVCITVGMAEIPTNACDALAWGRTAEERWLDSRRLRQQGVDAATWQAVNRVKDPSGEVESRAYFIGCRLEQVRRVATWGTNRQIICRDIKESKGSKGEIIKTPQFEVQVDMEVELPKIYGDGKDKGNSERRALSDFIEKVELYNSTTINSENNCKVSINYNRENAVKFRIYNIPRKEDEVDLTSNSLYSMFVNRTDCYAKQYQNPYTQKYEFYRVSGEPTVDKIKQHVTGSETIGVYQIALDDTVNWCCDDIDSHNGETDAREKVCRVVDTCRQYSIPFLLEASGSPDSYHIWIPLSRTRTYNAYRFLRQLNAEANVKCEAFPMQKSLKGKNGKYGNQVKLPVCFHLKSGGWSAFLDADTFEPIEGAVTHPGVVHLLEIPELSGSTAKGMPRPSAKKSAGPRQSNSTALDYCMQRALDDQVALKGSEGHHLRLAVAIKANKIGMTAEATAQLFQSQEDYDHDFSLNKVQETWSYNYSPWSCSTLRDKCGYLVKAYCPTCPFRHGVGEAVEEGQV